MGPCFRRDDAVRGDAVRGDAMRDDAVRDDAASGGVRGVFADCA
jgi:hypothetical protein